MNWKQILAAAGIALGSAVGGYYAAPESEMDASIAGIQTVRDTLTPEAWDWSTDTTGAHYDSVLVPERYIPISARINNSRVFNAGDTITYICIERCGDSTFVFGLRHAVNKKRDTVYQ